MKRAAVALAQLFAVLTAASAEAQVSAVPGDIVVTSSRPATSADGEPYAAGTLVVFGRDGRLKGELAVFSAPPLSDPLVRDGIIYVATRYPPGIQRFDLAGQPLAPLTTNVDVVNYLAPGPNGGLLAVNGLRQLYQFAADGSLVHFRDFPSVPRAGGGIELARDGCGVYWTLGASIVRWDACTHPEAEFATPDLLANTFGALRLLSDGSYLVSMENVAPILRLDQQGNVIRNYGIRGQGLALDIDGTTFWTEEFGWITRVELATGAILSRTFHGRTWGLAVVGEPRAGLLAHDEATGIPVAPPAVLVLVALLFSLLAIHRIR